MDIVLLHYSAPPIVGGVESVLGEHARLMAEAGHRVHIIAGRGEAVDKRVRFTRVPEVDSQHESTLVLKADLDAGKIPPGWDQSVARIEHVLRDLIADADWMILHNVCSLNKNLPLTAALKRISETRGPPRLILWHHDLAWTTPRYLPELHEGFPWDLLRTDWPQAVQVVVSESRRAELAALLGVPATRIRVVPNGLDPVGFHKLEPQTQSIAVQLKLLGAAPLMLLPVRITPRKNIELGLEALAVLRQQYPDARLIVTGPLGAHDPANAEYFGDLIGRRHERQLDQAAYFLAELSNELLPAAVIHDLYRLADLLLLPSSEEGFGIPILEAGLAGIPVFCSDIKVFHELGGSEAHYFSPQESAEQVAGKIAAFLATSAQYALRKRILQRYTWPKVYDQFIAPLLETGQA